MKNPFINPLNNSISNRWETKSIEVQEYDVNSYDLVLIAVSNKFKLI